MGRAALPCPLQHCPPKSSWASPAALWAPPTGSAEAPFPGRAWLNPCPWEPVQPQPGSKCVSETTRGPRALPEAEALSLGVSSGRRPALLEGNTKCPSWGGVGIGRRVKVGSGSSHQHFFTRQGHKDAQHCRKVILLFNWVLTFWLDKIKPDFFLRHGKMWYHKYGKRLIFDHSVSNTLVYESDRLGVEMSDAR